MATRDELVRRNTLLLIGAQATLNGMAATFFTLAVVAIVDMTDHERWGGFLLAIFNGAAALSAFFAGRLMDRAGRRPGLAIGYALLAASGLMGGAAIWADSRWALLGTSILFGAGYGSAQLGRLAAADMVPSERRGQTIGLVVAAGTVGAIAGAPIVAGIEAATGSTAAPWLMVPVLGLVGFAAVRALRPDPRDLAVREESAEPIAQPRPVRRLLRLTPFRAALVAICVAQTAMVATMGVAPVVIDEYGGSSLAIAVVISVHMVGMFALAPGIGYLLDRYGRRAGLLAGSVLSAGGALLGSLTEVMPLIGIGMFLVGLGWAACYLAATAVISDLTRAEERGSALGFADLLTSIASAAGALAGGFVLESAGIGIVGIAMAALMLPVLLLVAPLREPRPGAWLQPAPSRTPG